jgi:hypothetical protein
MIQANNYRWSAPILINILYTTWFDGGRNPGVRKEIIRYYLFISEKLILYTATIIRWVITEKKNKARIGKPNLRRFEKDQIKYILSVIIIINILISFTNRDDRYI